MKNVLSSAGLFALIWFQLACTGVKNVSGTLTKSESGHRDYTSSSVSESKTSTLARSQRDSLVPASSVTSQDRMVEPIRVTQSEGAYKRDYSRSVNGVEKPVPTDMPSALNTDINAGIVKQYAEMDRLADLVLYELGIVERRWDQLLARFKSASATEREKISADLDQLGADQLKLYRAHVKIYKEGKTDWLGTQKDVEAVLLGIRGLGNK
jgi:hypothetical protein